MALDKENAAKEESKYADCTTRIQPLIDRWDDDFKLFTMDESMYKIPTKEGEWEYAPINAAATDGNRMIDLLSYATEKLQIAITDENHKGRKDLADTEYTAIGLLYHADQISEDDPESSSIRAQASAYAIIRGWTAYCALLTEEDGEGFPSLNAWDPYNVRWIYGRNRYLWVCNSRYSTPGEIQDEYPDWKGYLGRKDVAIVGGQGAELIQVYDTWECADKDKPAENGVSINGEWVKKPEKVRVGNKPLYYIPVRIKGGRSLPLIKGGGTNQTENIRHVGESYLVNTRLTLPMESRLMSYKLTRAGQLAKAPGQRIFDSTKTDGQSPDPFEKSPYLKGRTITIDKGKGEEPIDWMTPPNGTEIDSMLAQTTGMRMQGSGMGPVAYGMPPYPDTAQGTDIINHNILDALKPFKLLLEKDRVWQAEEFIRQYKMGAFKGQEFEGYDYRGKRFKAKVNPKNIDDNWHFKCEYVLDLVRDENLHVGMAATEVKIGLLSKQTARDHHNLVADPDHEQEIINRERAEQVGELALLDTAKELWEEKDDWSRMKAMQIFIKIMGNSNQPQQGEGNGNGAEAGVMPPEATAGAARTTARRPQPSIPAPVVEAAQRRGGVNA